MLETNCSGERTLTAQASAVDRPPLCICPNDLTYKMDIALASAGMEGRAPFLDHRLLEWAQSLSPGDLVRGGAKKLLLRAAYRGALPDEVLDRRKLRVSGRAGRQPGCEWPLMREVAKDIVPCAVGSTVRAADGT